MLLSPCGGRGFEMHGAMTILVHIYYLMILVHICNLKVKYFVIC